MRTLWLVAVPACTWIGKDEHAGRFAEDSASIVDADQDGASAEVDCDDGDPAVHPGATDGCNGRDDDCDDIVDENVADAPVWHPDRDSDGYGADDERVTACAAEPGWVTDGSDCDDSDETIFPGAAEDACTGLDQNCDGDVADAIRVPGTHSTIAEAAADVTDGSLLCIGAGEWSGSVFVDGHTLEVRGAGSDITTLDLGGDTGSVVTVWTQAAHLTLSGITLTGGRSNAGAGLWVSAGTAVLDDVVLTGNECADTNSRCDAVLAVHSGSLDATNLSLRENTPLRVTGTNQQVHLAYFDTATVTWNGGGIYDNEILVPGIESGGRAYAIGSLLYSVDSTLEWNGVSLEGNAIDLAVADGDDATDLYGVALGLYVFGGPSWRWTGGSVRGNTMTSNVPESGTSLGYSRLLAAGNGNAMDVQWEGIAVTGNTISHPMGSGESSLLHFATLADDTVVTSVQGIEINGNILEGGDDPSVVKLSGTGETTFGTMDVRANEIRGGSVVGLWHQSAGTVAIQNAIFAGNQVLAEGTIQGLVTLSGGSLAIDQAVFTGNETAGTIVEGGLFRIGAGFASFHNTTTDANLADAGTLGARTLYADDRSSVTSLWSNWIASVEEGLFRDAAGEWTPSESNGNLSVAPGYVDVTSSDPLDWDLHLASSSLLIDMGDPTTQDVDGSRSDVGAFGGPGGSW